MVAPSRSTRCLRKSHLCPMHEQRANFVPEIAAQHEQAAQQHQIADDAKGELVTDVAGNPVGEVRRKPTEKNRHGEHHEAYVVADAADLGRWSILFEEAEGAVFDKRVTAFTHDGDGNDSKHF